MKTTRLLAAVAVSLTIAGWTQGAAAAVVIDVNQPLTVSGTGLANFNQADLAQSFMPTAGNVAGAGFLSRGTGSGNITISLFNALPNAGGSLLATGSAAYVENDWIDVFWTPVIAAAGATLFLVFDSDNDTGGISGSTGDAYSDGLFYANAGFTAFPGLDAPFRTFTDTEVPEPVTLALFGLGLAGLGLAARRRKAY